MGTYSTQMGTMCTHFHPPCTQNGVGLEELLDQPYPVLGTVCPSFGTGLIEYQKKITDLLNMVMNFFLHIYTQGIILEF